MTLSSVWALAIPIIVAIFGGAAKYWNDLRIAQRKDRLERVNQLLRQLYGPLYAQIEAGDQAWAAFSKKFRSTTNSLWHSQSPPNAEEKAAWRLWMTEVFMPNNLRLEALIVNNADLLIETHMPDCLLTLCAHVAAYKAVLRQWEHDDFTEHTAPIIFPRSALREYVGPAYRRLKAEQAELLGRLQSQVERNAVEGRAA